MPYEIASAYVSIVPTMRGFDSKINDLFKGVTQQADRTGTESGDSFLGGFKGKALAGIAGIGLAVGTAFMDAYSEALDVKGAQAKAQASLGLSPDEAKGLGRTAGSLYAAGYGDSIGELTDSVGSIQSAFQNLKLPDGQLEKLTGKALSFSQAFGGDVESVAQNVNTLLGSGLVKNADEAFDLLTKSSQKVPAALRGDIADASDEYSQFFRTLGFSGNQAFDALVNGASKGTFGIDKTGDAIKEFTIRATDMSTSSTAAFQSLGLDAQGMTNSILAGGDSAKGAFNQITDALLNVQDPAAQSQAALALFGTPLEDMNVQDIPEFLQGLKGMSGGMGDAAGAADAMDQAMGSTTSGIELLWRNMKSKLVGFISDQVIPAISSFTSWVAENLTPVINDLTVWLGEHLAPVIQKVSDFFMTVLLPAGQQVWAWFEENLLPTVQRVGQFIGDTFGNLFTILGGIIDFIAGVFTGDWSRAWDGIKTIFSGIWDQIQNIIGLAWDVITGIGGKILDWLSGLPGWAWERISAFGSFLVEKGEQFLQWIWDGITTKASEVWDWFTALPQAVWNRVAAFGSWVLDRGKEFIGWIVQGIKDGASALWEWITGSPGDPNSLLGGIWSSFTSIGGKLLEFGGKVVGWIVDGIKAGIGKVADAITGLFDDLTFNPDGTISTPEGYVTANPFAGGSARGGVIPGSDPGRRDNVLGRLPNGVGWGLRSGESVFVPEFTKAIGGASTVSAWNRAAEQGRLSEYGFARGGVVGYGTTMAELTGKKMVGAGDPWAKTLIDSAIGKAKDFLSTLWSGLFGSSVSGGLNLSQDPSSFGWNRAQGIVPYSWNGNPILGGVAGGTEGLWGALLSALVPQIPGGLLSPLYGFENRNNVNSPGAPSFHSYGLAVDINAPFNGNGAPGYGRSGRGVIPAELAHSLAAKFGMLWGGDFSGTPDPMHFEIHVSPNQIGAGGILNQAANVASGLFSQVAGSGVERWRSTVLQALGLTGQPASYADVVLNQMRTESSGNPRAINLTDSNATVRGTPSKGLMQVIDPTFRAYALPGYSSDIYDPLSNIIASIRYVLARYGSIPAGMRGVAYDWGGWLMPGVTPTVNMLNKPEAVLDPAQSQAYITHAQAIADGYAGRTPAITVNNYIDGQQLDARTEIIVDGKLVQVGSELVTAMARS
ncbi:phage tail tape measure protein [Nakamurella sp.]|uniref:phage tail tape measure protein n=1 Tax=Nakamurella sp. TaxID=1869182 RepID=UPI003B3BC689